MEFLGAIGILFLLAALVPAPTMASNPTPPSTPTTTASNPTPEPATPEPETIVDQDDGDEQIETDGEDVTTEQPVNETGLTTDQIFDLANSEGITSYNGLNQYLKDATGSGVSKSTIKKWKLSRGFINDAS